MMVMTMINMKMMIPLWRICMVGSWPHLNPHELTSHSMLNFIFMVLKKEICGFL